MPQNLPKAVLWGMRAVWYGGTQHSSSHPKYKIYLMFLPKCMKSFFFSLYDEQTQVCVFLHKEPHDASREGHRVTSVISHPVSWLSKTYLALIEINLTGISPELGADTVLYTCCTAEPTAGSQHAPNFYSLGGSCRLLFRGRLTVLPELLYFYWHTSKRVPHSL